MTHEVIRRITLIQPPRDVTFCAARRSLLHLVESFAAVCATVERLLTPGGSLGVVVAGPR